VRLAFEDWLTGQSISLEAHDLFAEAVICHKTGAFKAAMLLSYLGFQTVIRDRILRANVPNLIPPGLWSSIQGDLRRDDKWDATVFDAIQRQSPISIFQIEDDIRNQVTYWKNRRNDCAHAKRNTIGQPHIEAFWLFVQSSLPRIVVSGSRAGLLSEIQRHFDPAVTPIGQSPTHLVAQIPFAVPPIELDSFLSDVVALASAFPKPLFSKFSDEAVGLFVQILRSSDASVASTAAEVFARDEELVVATLRRDPGVVSAFAADHALIRKIWHDHLFKYRRRDLRVLCGMVSAGVIPSMQMDESLKKAIVNFADEIPTPAEGLILSTTKFYSLLWDYAFVQGAIDVFDWANTNVNIVVHLLERRTIDREAVEVLCSVFGKHNHPFGLKEGLESFFSQNSVKQAEAKQAIATYGLPTPLHLPSLN